MQLFFILLILKLPVTSCTKAQFVLKLNILVAFCTTGALKFSVVLKCHLNDNMHKRALYLF